ncbi:MAG: 16S rRNA (guanine(966)-N(2))-methyltransferase RsmD [Microbacterium sp.]|uniref:16S rRNA (guanine(966)-N(2))-methyltransferase RsmD n=1 Tax=Microbacterium sp. TaxID=51671 RepID=UPI001AC0C5A2|nr:16S rRNA (guanine(966)-N(2))-methyltransferase RsmD [Microbacterium sp.]MBN9176199.1 16S rRNA (guanine(966)-N(2))-methyltransferase RsmD [Microbacterium sp.]
MTRIIAGAAGSLTLTVPEAGTRPTSDRVRESLFGALESADLVHGAAVLDLFAGSGALGLEALSRGAASADLVEKAPRAASVAERNARAVAKALSAPPARVHRAAADAFLRSTTAAFDLVFVDPPYDLCADDLADTLALLAPRLGTDAIVIVERATRSGEPGLPPELTVDRSKRYGDTTVWWLRRAQG